MNNEIQIALVDDDKLVIQLLADYLNNEPNLNICLTSNSGNSFLGTLQNTNNHPDIVLMDLKMNDGNGLETTAKLTSDFPELKVIVLSSYYKPAFVGHLLRSGANAFLSKETDKKDLVFIIRQVMEKGHYFASEQVKTLRDQISHKITEPPLYNKEKLSAREVEVLILICQQFTAKEIAVKLFISVKTVETHKSNLLLKTGVKNTAGLIIYAAQQRLINPDEFVILE